MRGWFLVQCNKTITASRTWVLSWSTIVNTTHFPSPPSGTLPVRVDRRRHHVAFNWIQCNYFHISYILKHIHFHYHYQHMLHCTARLWLTLNNSVVNMRDGNFLRVNGPIFALLYLVWTRLSLLLFVLHMYSNIKVISTKIGSTILWIEEGRRSKNFTLFFHSSLALHCGANLHYTLANLG